MPWQAWPEFERRFEAEQAALAEALDAYATNFQLVRGQAERAFGQLVVESAKRLAATGQPIAYDFAEALLREMLAALAGPDVLRQQLVLRYHVGVFWLGSEMLVEQRQAAEERRRVEALEHDQRLERSRQTAQDRLVQEQLWAEQERLRAQQRTEAEEQRREAAVKEQLRQLKLQAARERLSETLSPIEEGARQLQATVFEAAVAIRESLRKNRALHGSSAKRALY